MPKLEKLKSTLPRQSIQMLMNNLIIPKRHRDNAEAKELLGQARARNFERLLSTLPRLPPIFHFLQHLPLMLQRPIRSLIGAAFTWAQMVDLLSATVTGLPTDFDWSFPAEEFLIGGTVGNFRRGPWVLGLEVDADCNSINGGTSSAGCAAIGPGPTCQTSGPVLGTGRLRAGYTF
jgi:hypothetical protein